MEYGVKDVLQRSLTSRQERTKLQDRLQSARKESETLREYSRRRFQTVVDWETRQTAPPLRTTPKTPTSSRPKTTTGTRQPSHPQPPPTPTTPTNGPTKDGSILYNGKPLLLNSIRTRPNSEPPSRFDHLRGAHGKAYPYIQRTLEQSNCEYRVGVTPCNTAREDRPEGAMSPDFVMLIPVTSEASDVTADDDSITQDGSPRWGKGQAWMEEAPLLASTARSRSPRSGERPDSRMESEAPMGTEGQDHRVCFREGEVTNDTAPARESSAVISVPQIVPDNPGPPSPSTPSPSPGPADTRSRNNALSPVPTNPARPPSSTSSRPHSARSQVSSVSSISITPRPHCWVDDVTVSSDESVAERELFLQNDLDDRLSVHSQDPAARALVPGLAAQLPRVGSPSGEKQKTLTLSKRGADPLLKRSPNGGKAKTGGGGGGCPRSLKQSTASGSKVGAGDGVEEGERLATVKEGDAAGGEGQELVLPRFACPSSESKSRQAAIKEWLAKTSFASACRTVPLT